MLVGIWRINKYVISIDYIVNIIFVMIIVLKDTLRKRKELTYNRTVRFRMTLRDWRQALNSSPTYRIGNGTLRFQTKFVTVITFLGLAALIFLYSFLSVTNSGSSLLSEQRATHSPPVVELSENYNDTYPLTFPKYLPQGVQFRIGIITDLDTNSKSKTGSNIWISYYKKGNLIWNASDKRVFLSWDDEPVLLKSSYGLDGRGMELSELVVFDGKLLTFDDRTGIVYEIIDEKVIPWIILMDGNGKVNKGFKSEWATVKDGKLYVGSIGKEWTSSSGEYINSDPMWIKVISRNSEVNHINWIENYKKLRKSVGVDFPGYMIHEAGIWSEAYKRWFFLPRRSSPLQYNDLEDEYKSTNVLLSTDNNFGKIQVTHIGEVHPTRGFSSFKFIPTTNDNVIVALKSEEYNGTFATYITSFTVDGEILLPETKIADMKFEGIEFV